MTPSLPPRLPLVIAAEKRRTRIIAVISVSVAGLFGLVFLSLLILRLFGLLIPFNVSTGAMAPAIAAGDDVIMEGITYWVRKPKRGDILVFKTDQIPQLAQSAVYTKRIVGLPGDRLSLADGVLQVNGEATPLRNRAGEIRYVFLRGTRYLMAEGETVAVPEKHYFVLGDNSAHSADSRFWGFVPEESIKGRNVFCYWPLRRIGPIK